MLIDTHAHLNDFEAFKDYHEVITALNDNGIERVIVIGADRQSSIIGAELANKYPEVYAAIGTHPGAAEEFTEDDFNLYLSLAKSKRVVAIGESGVDYHYEGYNKALQAEVFIKHILLAHEAKLPLAVHIRDAYEDALNLLKQHKDRLSNGAVLHCYSGSVEYMKEVLALGLDIAIGGAVTFKNANRLLDVAKAVPLERLHLETDCPYLCPDRGKRNEPRYVNAVAEKIAQLKGIEVERVAEQTRLNALRLFPRLLME